MAIGFGRVCSNTAIGITTATTPFKLEPNYFDAYQILQRVGMVSYKLQLPPRTKIHDAFHVPLLKKFKGACCSVSSCSPSRVAPWSCDTNSRKGVVRHTAESFGKC